MKPMVFVLAAFTFLPLSAAPSFANQPSTQARYDAATTWVSSTGDGYLNLRAGPSTDYRVLRQMRTGSRLTVLSRDGNWARVVHTDSGSVGWAHSSYFSDQNPATAINHIQNARQVQAAVRTTAPAPKIVNVTPRAAWVSAPNGHLNMRTGPGTGYAVRLRLDHGLALTVIAKQGSWRKVQLSGSRTGWVHGNYLSQNPVVRQPAPRRNVAPPRPRTVHAPLHRHSNGVVHRHPTRHSNGARVVFTWRN